MALFAAGNIAYTVYLFLPLFQVLLKRNYSGFALRIILTDFTVMRPQKLSFSSYEIRFRQLFLGLFIIALDTVKRLMVSGVGFASV